MSNRDIFIKFLKEKFTTQFKTKRALPEFDFELREKLFLEDMERQSKDLEGLTKLKLVELAQRVWNRYEFSWVTPNKLVGIISAHALGEGQTQANLDSKRLTGVSKGKAKVDAFTLIDDLVRFTNVKNPDDVVYFKSGSHYSDIFPHIYEIEMVRLADVMISGRVEETEDKEWRKLFTEVFGVRGTSSVHFKYELDDSKLIEAGLTVADVANKIKDPRFRVYYSHKECIIEFHSIAKTEDKNSLVDELSPLIELQDTLIKGVRGIKRIHPEKVSIFHTISSIKKKDMIEIRLDKAKMDEYMLYLEDVLAYFELRYGAVSENGVIYVDTDMSEKEFRADMNTFHIDKKDLTPELIEEYNISKDDLEGEIVPLVEFYQASLLWHFDTDGSNIFDILRIPLVDRKRSYCDDPNWILAYHGVEATREYYIRKLLSTISFTIAPANVKLLADVVMSRELVKITGKGHNVQETGFLDKISFEEKMQYMQKAAVAGQIDKLQTNYSTVITSRLHDIGSNSVTLRPIMDDKPTDRRHNRR